MAELFEAIMVICFGASWPLSVYKSFRSRTAKGKSLLFECLIAVGYLFGIIGKIITANITYVFFFYILYIIMVSADICLYLRNRRIDSLAAQN